MSRPPPDVLVMLFPDATLSVFGVREVERRLEAHRPAPAVVDLSKTDAVSAAGLSALLGLGRKLEGEHEVALACLSKVLTLSAIQARLSDRFPIYVSCEAFIAEVRTREGAHDALPDS